MFKNFISLLLTTIFWTIVQSPTQAWALLWNTVPQRYWRRKTEYNSVLERDEIINDEDIKNHSKKKIKAKLKRAKEKAHKKRLKKISKK